MRSKVFVREACYITVEFITFKIWIALGVYRSFLQTEQCPKDLWCSFSLEAISFLHSISLHIKYWAFVHPRSKCLITSLTPPPTIC